MAICCLNLSVCACHFMQIKWSIYSKYSTVRDSRVKQRAKAFLVAVGCCCPDRPPDFLSLITKMAPSSMRGHSTLRRKLGIGRSLFMIIGGTQLVTLWLFFQQ